MVVPFAFTDGGEQASASSRALLPQVEPLLEEIRAELAKRGRLDWVDLGAIDPTELQIALGERGGGGVLEPGSCRTLAKAAEAPWILMGELKREVTLDPQGALRVRLAFRLAVYDAQLATLVHDADAVFVRSQPGVTPSEPLVVPAELLRRILREVREDVVARVLNAAFPPRIQRLRKDGAIELGAGEEVGLHPRQVLEFFESRRSQAPLGRLRVEYVGAGTALARPLEGEPREGLYVRPLDEGRRAKTPPRPVQAAPARSTGFLLKALAATVALISVPLLITIVIERRKPKRSAAERIRVTETTRRGRRRAGAAAWEAGLEERLRRAEERRRDQGGAPRRPGRATSAWEMHKVRKLQIHAVGESKDSDDSADSQGSQDSHVPDDVGIDMGALAAEGPAGSFAYASAASRLRDLVDEAWATSSHENLIPEAIELEAPPEPATPRSGGAEVQAPAKSRAHPRGRTLGQTGPSSAQRRLDDLLGD